MAIYTKQLIERIIKPTLDKIGLSGRAAEQLVAGTIAQESLMGSFISQIDGPALGIAQVEPFTHYDIYKNFLLFRDDLKNTILQASDITLKKEEKMPNDNLLITNLSYAVCMCRMVYYRVPERLPDENDIEGMADYWKEHYNTPLGLGTKPAFMKSWERYLSDYYGKFG